MKQVSMRYLKDHAAVIPKYWMKHSCADDHLLPANPTNVRFQEQRWARRRSARMVRSHTACAVKTAQFAIFLISVDGIGTIP